MGVLTWLPYFILPFISLRSAVACSLLLLLLLLAIIVTTTSRRKRNKYSLLMLKIHAHHSYSV